jgi:hypothetical protein
MVYSSLVGNGERMWIRCKFVISSCVHGPRSPWKQQTSTIVLFAVLCTIHIILRPTFISFAMEDVHHLLLYTWNTTAEAR